MKVNSGFILVERLAAIPWLFYVLPHLINRGLKHRKKCKVYFIDGTKTGIFLARLTVWRVKASVEKLQFQLTDIKDDAGNLLRLRITYFDVAAVQRKILENPAFQEIVQNSSDLIKNRISRFLTKQIGTFKYHEKSTIRRALILIHLVCWKVKQDLLENEKPILFMNEMAWMEEIKSYALQYKVEVIPVKNTRFSFKSFLLRVLRFKIGGILKNLYFCFLEKDFRPVVARFVKPVKVNDLPAKKNALPKLGVEYYGHLNLEHPELHSDLFFWQQSALSGKDILLTFNISSDPIDEKKWAQISRHQISVVSLSPKAKTIAAAPLFYHWPGYSKFPLAKFKSKNKNNTRERKWFFQYIQDYYGKYDYWSDFFIKYNVKVFMSWYKYDTTHYAITDALRDAGGVSAIYQRAFEEFPSPETTTAADIVFGFSKLSANIEQRSNSIVPYYVITGYLGGHRFSLVKDKAQAIRDKLKGNGAKHILAFFDENSIADSRWRTGHEFIRRNYEFLLGKVLEEPWLGLAIKPKAAFTLRKRLGPVAELLKRAEETGRCFVFEGGVLHGAYPPVIAALAADITIHGHLCAATAGVESALAGAPTLLLDVEGWPVSSFYKKLGKDRVVFTSWPDLWKACKDHWASPTGISGFGDWSAMLDELDSFRDGRAAERMGTYLKWLLDGFKSGLSRDTVLADAAARYTKIWGKDKIASIGN